MSTTLLLYALKVCLIQAIAYAAYRWLLEDTPGAQRFNRWYLLLAPWLALAIPLLTIREVTLPSIPITPIGTNASFVDTIDAGTSASIATTDWTSLLWPLTLIIYAAGVAYALSKLLRNIWLLRRQQTEAVAINRQDGVTYYGLPRPVPVHTFGRSIYYCVHDTLQDAIRAHELAHVRQRHSVDRVLLAIIKALCWFNPVLRYYERSAIHNHELLADAAVITDQGITPLDYQLSLLASLGGPATGPALSSLLPYSFTKKRFLMLQQPTSSTGRRAIKIAAVLSVWLPLLFMFGATSYAQQTTTAPPPPPPPRVVLDGQLPPPPPPPSDVGAPAPPQVEIAPAPPGPDGRPALPPPPPPSFDLYMTNLDMTLGEYYDNWERKVRADYPNRTHFPYGPKTEAKRNKTFRQVVLERKENDLKWVTGMQPLDQNTYEKYLNDAEYAVWVDKRFVPADQLANYGAARLYEFRRPSRLLPNAVNYGKYKYQVELRSEDWRQAELAKLPKEIATLRAGL